jgi:hypothetical protein
MWVVVYKWYIWPKHNNALVTNSSVKSRRGTIGIQLSTLEICSASFLFLPALYYGCFYSMLAVNSFNPELSSFNNSTLSGAFTPNLNHKFLTLIFCDAVWMSQMNTCVFTKLNVLFQFSSVWVIAITSWRHCHGAFTPGKFGGLFCRPWCVLEHTNREPELVKQMSVLSFKASFCLPVDFKL